MIRDGENWFDNSAALEHLWLEGNRAVATVAELTLGDAQRHAPVLEGTLRGSGTVLEAPEVPAPRVPTVIERVVAFPIEYAAKQEVDEEYVHPLGGEAHFLGNSLKAHTGMLAEALGKLGL